MIIKNSPKGDKKSDLSAYHKGLPNRRLLQMYFDNPDHPLIRDLFANIQDKKVLDIGCGLGSILCEGLLRYGLKPDNLYSLDLDSHNFEKDEYPRIHKVVGSAESMVFESNSFDMVHSNEMTIDNLELDYISVLKEICRVLKPGGFYLANEKFDVIFKKSKSDPLILKSTSLLIDLVEDSKLMRKLGFNPMERLRYFQYEKDPNIFAIYLFQKSLS